MHRRRRPAADHYPRVEIRSVAELRAWLAAHHAASDGVWLVTWPARPGAPYVSRWDVLDELLCVGWIDGARRAIGGGRTMQLVTPRRTDAWTATYRARVARLEAEGRMRDAGRAAIARARAAGTWLGDLDVDALVVPADLRAALDAHEPAAAWFDATAPSYRRNVLRWIAKAKGDDTRAARVARTVDCARAWEKVPQL